ncbi:MAG: DUF1540 domain-containing protein [Clostridia bacterium]|nr:DUF1540 domain-containing protein [Clostridia bacterium]
MDKKQKINCTVSSCIYNDTGDDKCLLEEISVEPCSDCTTKQPDESMCGSYEYDEEDE